MKLPAPLLPMLVLFTLTACAPQATVASPDDAALKLVVLPRGDVAVVADKPIEYGDVRLKGPGLALESDFCAVPGCIPNERDFIRLTFPDEKDRAYPNRIEIDVTAGGVELGRAHITLQGEDVSREALLDRR